MYGLRSLRPYIRTYFDTGVRPPLDCMKSTFSYMEKKKQSDSLRQKIENNDQFS